jgi:hypothetical protein
VELAPELEAPYRTRVLVRRPVDLASASGTVVVEWLNVSGGIDANPDWTSLADEIVRQGTPGWGSRPSASGWRVGRCWCGHRGR